MHGEKSNCGVRTNERKKNDKLGTECVSVCVRFDFMLHDNCEWNSIFVDLSVSVHNLISVFILFLGNFVKTH